MSFQILRQYTSIDFCILCLHCVKNPFVITLSTEYEGGPYDVSGIHIASCSPNRWPYEREVCEFKDTWLQGRCSKAEEWGYTRGQPCILLTPNQVVQSHPYKPIHLSYDKRFVKEVPILQYRLHKTRYLFSSEFLLLSAVYISVRLARVTFKLIDKGGKMSITTVNNYTMSTSNIYICFARCLVGILTFIGNWMNCHKKCLRI